MKGQHILSVGLAGVFFVTAGGSALAQATDPSQLDALGRIQDSQDARRVALQNAQVQAQAQAQRQAAARAAAQQRAAAKIAAQAHERVLAAQQARAAQQAQEAREHQDDRSYLDANRAMDIEERRLQLKMMEAKANHADDYAKQDLQQQQTTTDIARTMAAGNQKLKEDVGQAAKMSQRHWWELGSN